MKSIQKLTLPALVALLLGIIYFSYFAPSEELGDFSKFGESEVNQRINVEIIKEKGFQKNATGNIISFTAKDKNNTAVKVLVNEYPDGIENADVVELLGHMHGNQFNSANIKIIK